MLANKKARLYWLLLAPYKHNSFQLNGMIILFFSLYLYINQTFKKINLPWTSIDNYEDLKTYDYTYNNISVSIRTIALNGSYYTTSKRLQTTSKQS